MPTYVLYGKETYLLEDKVKGIIQEFTNNTKEDLNVVEFDMEEETIQTAINEAEEYSFFGGEKIVITRNANFLTSDNNKEVNHDVNYILSFLEKNMEDSILILIVNQEKLDQRKKVVKELNKKAIIFEAKTLNQAETATWILKYANNKNIQISNESVQELIVSVGCNLRCLKNEVDKLYAYSNGGKEITMDAIAAVTVKSLEQSIFNLSEYLLSHDTHKAIGLFNELILKKHNPIQILATLIYKFDMLFKIKVLQNDTKDKDLIGILGCHPYVLQKSKEQIKEFNLSKDDLGNILCILTEADNNMKMGKDSYLTMEILITKISELLRTSLII
ncbi:DNA polymerase III subunit delta [Bacillus cereus]|uniref:DNA polymerase III subunit delta n=1 Tax=Bacillus cereus TaxID=1396 RepID=UPI002407684F|nr:DNA polymerase III subunit delta [Bacillus cereus]MDF9505789.1 DNA polymerase III subunit delta [Bacillus cereus]MDF9596486.1 DNA polymerase III subunit delta [Bacillus cereus]MDF9608086.1 DNA polymerase III subunit delta [Bacillus cereus]MDF9659299.1 DNA polymerase III subunit delta [Bacillus cereus]